MIEERYEREEKEEKEQEKEEKEGGEGRRKERTIGREQGGREERTVLLTALGLKEQGLWVAGPQSGSQCG